jgi:hypothetical protein
MWTKTPTLEDGDSRRLLVHVICYAMAGKMSENDEMLDDNAWKGGLSSR